MRLLVTAGPTREPIDPVRYLSNRSSGKMGYALAEAARDRGHEVVLVSGPVSLTPPQGVDTVAVETAEEMFRAVAARIGSVDAAIFCAAVSDYRVAEVAPEKRKKSDDGWTLRLVRTPDILGSARGDLGFRGILVGFAAETERVEANGREKLERKGCDLLVANDVGAEGIGFGSDENEVVLLYRDGSREALPRAAKSVLAATLVERIERLHRGAAGA